MIYVGIAMSGVVLCCDAVDFVLFNTCLYCLLSVCYCCVMCSAIDVYYLSLLSANLFVSAAMYVLPCDSYSSHSPIKHVFAIATLIANPIRQYRMRGARRVVLGALRV